MPNKDVGINWSELFNVNGAAFPWTLLAVIYLLIDVFVIGPSDWTFPFGILYAFGFIAVSIVLAAKKVGFLAGLMAALIPGFAVFASLGQFDAYIGMGVSIFALVLLLFNEYEWIEWKGKTVAAKYLVFAAFLFWIIWAVSYFAARILWGWELPLATVLNHGGLFLLALDGILRLGGVVKENQWLKWIGLGASIVGALWLTVALGWGLQLAGVSFFI